MADDGFRHFPMLDLAENSLLHSYISTEVSDENRPHIKTLIEVIQTIRGREHPNGTKRDWNALYMTAEPTVKKIECKYCRNHEKYDLLYSIQVAGELDLAHYKHALKLMLIKDLMKNGWLLLAFYFRLVRPWLVKHHCRKLLY